MESFNTGRKYTAEGQIIEWEQIEDTVYFYDRSRMINGKFKVPEPYLLSSDFKVEILVDKNLIMNMYDQGKYENI